MTIKSPDRHKEEPRKCPECGTFNPDEERTFCRKCGHFFEKVKTRWFKR